ncbi:YciI family protein [Microbacterium sp. cf332]|uniref:YciI family protein n=1 Tax=Microbacterium sp. cf332 TaxID=1761804 RepID=UPI000886FC3B|nr:YciI family protein [Microbacterium sp. cf332]SDQ86170.1 Uncharacterized conserved protein [Microbacterium sp. cf332]
MKVMLLMRSDGTYDGGNSEEDYAVWSDYTVSLEEQGVYVTSGQFEDGAGGTLLTELTENRSPEKPQPADGTPAGSLVGYYILECADFEEASRHARRAPLYGSVEVLPLSAW